MGAIIAVVLILGCLAAVSTTVLVIHVRRKRRNKPVPIDPKEAIKQIERSQHAEWDDEYRRLMRLHSKEKPTEKELSLIKGWDPYDDDGEMYEVRSFNGAVVYSEFIPHALAVSMTKADITSWQYRARGAGLYNGPCNGVMGPEVWYAIRELDRRSRGWSIPTETLYETPSSDPPNPSIILEL